MDKPIKGFSGKFTTYKDGETGYDLIINREKIYIDTLNELKSRIGKRTPYDLVRKGAILRFLLIDGSSFYRIINKYFKLKIKFDISKSVLTGGKFSLTSHSTLSYSIYTFSFENKNKKYNIDDFLNFPVIETNDSSLKKFLKNNHISDNYTVKTLIKLIANAHGGVHIENWNDFDLKKIFFEETSPLNINPNSVMNNIIDNISLTLIKILAPLTLAVEKRLETLSGTNQIIMFKLNPTFVEDKENKKHSNWIKRLLHFKKNK